MVNVLHIQAWIFAGYIGSIRATDCPDTWIAFQGSCYHLETESKLKFIEAEQFCRQRNAHLVHVDISDENTFLKYYLRTNNHNDSWIGLDDIQIEGIYTWYDDGTKPTFTDWAPAEPNDGGHVQDCTIFSRYYDYKWDDVRCDALCQPVCEIRREHTEIIG